MNKRKINNRESIILNIQNELSSNADAKYFHRLDLVLLAVNGMPVKEIAALYNESPTTISYWTKKAVEKGVKSLKEGFHTGRKPRLNEKQLEQLESDLCKSPENFGYDMVTWDGIVLSKHISDHYNVNLQVRQCQRIIRKLGFTLQRPQSIPNGSSKEERDAFKKN
jgi:transposase